MPRAAVRIPRSAVTSRHASSHAFRALVTLVALSGCGGDEPDRTSGTVGATSPPVQGTLAVAASSSAGRWEGPYPWPLIPIHVHLLPDGRVLAWGGEANMTGPNHGQRAVFWNPVASPANLTSTLFTTAPAPGGDVFCSGHAFFPDGRLLVAGGHAGSGVGIPDVNVFNFAGGWARGPRMAKGRWYPTVTTLPNGEMLVTAGTDSAKVNVTIPEVMRADGSWRRLTSASRLLPYYPWMFVAPNGRVFYAGAGRESRYLSTASTGGWSYRVGYINHTRSRTYGSAVMYEPGKVLIVGGGDPPTSTAEVIDLTSATPRWRYTGGMAFARRQHNATLLPDGQVLVTGGTSGPGFNNKTTPVYAAEIWNPATGVWTQVASMSAYRLYHATALLLPDGRVLVAGGGRQKAVGTAWDRLDAEIYSPPYLFNSDGSAAVRPTITAAPSTVGYGATFDVETPDAATVAKVTWIRLGSVTHAFDQNQRFTSTRFSIPAPDTTVVLDPLTRLTDTLVTPPPLVRVTSPANPNLAPPGHYMLFILNARGVPSPAKIIRLKP